MQSANLTVRCAGGGGSPARSFLTQLDFGAAPILLEIRVKRDLIARDRSSFIKRSGGAFRLARWTISCGGWR